MTQRQRHTVSTQLCELQERLQQESVELSKLKVKPLPGLVVAYCCERVSESGSTCFGEFVEFA